jgi:hypothetical protein
MLLISLGSSAAVFAGDANMGYAQASGYLKQDTRPTLFQPLNLLDGRDNTAWCSPSADPLNEVLTFGLNSTVQIDELKITTGNNFDEGTFGQFSRARKLLIKSGKEKRTVNLEDVRGVQSISITPPLSGSRFFVEVLDHYPSDDPDASTCITDMIFVSAGKPYSGPWLTTKLKYDKATAAIMGSWYLGFDKTPDRSLSFNFDGTYRYSYEPFDKTRNQPKEISGRYDVSSSKIIIDFNGKKYSLKYSKDASKKEGFQLSFDGEMPEELKGQWRSSL